MLARLRTVHADACCLIADASRIEFSFSEKRESAETGTVGHATRQRSAVQFHPVAPSQPVELPPRRIRLAARCAPLLSRPPAMSSSTLADFEVLQQLGKGSYGTVFKVRRKGEQGQRCRGVHGEGRLDGHQVSGFRVAD